MIRGSQKVIKLFINNAFNFSYNTLSTSNLFNSNESEKQNMMTTNKCMRSAILNLNLQENENHV